LESKDHVPHALTGNDLVSDTPHHAHVAAGSPPGSAPATETPVDPDAGSWSSVVVIVALFVLLYFLKFDLGAILKTVLGLAFVVFIHELGHFLAAKWCDVNVTTFSIGFGPAIWARKWGETIYQLAAIPLGGYVQMVGQVDGDEAADGSDNDPRSFRNKGVGQRMLIISAGVIMNVILAVIAYVLVFMIPGKMRNPAIVAYVDSGGPAFVEGLRTGDVVKKVGSISDPYFEDLKFVVALSRAKDEIPFEVMLPGGTVRSMKMEPRRNEEDSNPVIGVAPPKQLKIFPRSFVDPTLQSPNEKGSPADLAGFEFGDEIVATSDPDNPKELKPLPQDPRAPKNMTRENYFEFQRRMQLLADKDVVVQVRRTKGKESETVDLKVAPAWRMSLGMRMGMDQIVALRKESPAAKAGLLIPATTEGKSREGDRIDRVMLLGEGKKVLVYDSNPKAPAKEKVAEWMGLAAADLSEVKHQQLDPDRLPEQLKQWARGIKGEKKVYLGIRRHRDQPGQQYDELVKPLDWDDEWTFDRQLATSPLSPQAIPELGLAYQVTTTVESLDASFKDHPLQPGDVVLNAKVHTAEKPEGGPWVSKKDFGEKQWAHVYLALSSANPKNVTKVTLKVKGDKEPRTIEITPTEDQFGSIERGWGLMDDSRVQKADSVGEAITMGLSDTNKSVLQVFLGIRGMLTGRINFLKNIGGPLSIAGISYRVAGFNTWEFVFFLGMISINLAVINFLPVPVLDGGHMVFLIYEKIRGKPASEGVRVALTYVGLALILSLMIFVLGVDFSKFFM
jgi:regulator of sigma E protease